MQWQTSVAQLKVATTLQSPVKLLSFRSAPSCAAMVLIGVIATSLAPAQSSRPGVGSIPYADALGTGVTFRVWAPNASSVAVRGNFNSGGWNNTSNYLVKEAGTEYWSKDVPNLKPADTNQYKYFLSANLWKRDPRGRKVVNSSDNTIIYDPNAFNWGGDTRLQITTSDLVIYEMHIGAFYDSTPSTGGPGKFADAITKLDYLTNLGINAVELMPLSEFAGDYSWGYNPAELYAVENTAYGGPDGLKSFVKAAHQRGIRVLLDVVHNHYGPSDLDLYTFDNGVSPSIYFYTGDKLQTPWGANRPNYSTEGVRSFIIDNIRMWLDEYHIDGFRWDAVGAIRYYDPGHVNLPEADSLLQYINSTVIHSQHPGAISIAEDQSSGLNFDGEWAVGFGDSVINQMVQSSDSNRDMNTLQGTMNGSGFGRVLYTETHDLAGNLNGSGAQRLPKRIHSTDPTSFFARKRSMLGAAIVMSSPGIPMLFMGQEMLAITQFGDNAPLDWTHVNTYSNVVNFYRDFIRLRRNLDGVTLGFTGPNISWHTVDNTAKILSFHRWGAGPNDQVMVVLNCSNTSITNYAMSGFPANGNWYVNLNSDWPKYGSDFLNRGSSVVSVSGGAGNISVGPYSVLVMSRTALPNLDSDGDGLLNGWEQTYFGDPVSASATADNDNDGMNNLQEQTANTSPNSAGSVLRFTDIHLTGTNLSLSWHGGQAARQIIQESASLDSAWTPIFTNQPPTAITNNLVIPVTTQRFYRIQIDP